MSGLTEYAERLAADAPELTDAQRDVILAAFVGLRPAGDEEAA